MKKKQELVLETISNKKVKPKVKFTYHNPNTREKTQEFFKKLIVQMLLDKKMDIDSHNYEN